MDIKAPLRETIDFITHGVTRAQLRGTEPVWELVAVTADPIAPTNTRRAGLYLRVDGGKGQLMIVFPSGAAQILATEP